MSVNRRRTGIAVAATVSLVLSGSSFAHAETLPNVPLSIPVSPQAEFRLDLSNPIYIDGQDVVIFGNRFPLVQAGAVATLSALGGALGITALIMRSAGCSSSDASAAGLSSCLENPHKRKPPMFGEQTIYDDDGDQAKINPLARGISVNEAESLFPNGDSQVGSVVTVPDSTLTALELQEGSILSVPPSDDFPVGQLVKIAGINSVEGISRIVTEQASLDDVILQTDGPFELTGTPTRFEVSPARGATFEAVGNGDGFTSHASGREEFVEFEFEKNFLEGLSDEEKKNLDQFSIHGSLKLGGEWTFERGRGDEDGEYSIAVVNDVETHMDYKASASKEILDKTWEIGDAEGRFRFLAGSFPIYMTTEFQLNVKASASANAETTFNPSYQHTQRIGAKYVPDDNELVGDVQPVIDVDSEPEVNLNPPQTTAKIEASVGPELTLEAVLYKMLGVGGSAELRLDGEAEGKTEDQSIGAVLRILFVPAIKVFAQPFVKKGRKEKEFEKEIEIRKLEKTWNLESKSQEDPDSLPSADEATERRLTGVVREMDVEDLTGQPTGPNGEPKTNRYYVLELDAPTPVTARASGNMLRPETRTVNRVSLGVYETWKSGSPIDTRGNWPSLVGKRVAFDYDPEKASWPSDTAMPVGMVRGLSATNLALVKTGACTTSAINADIAGESWDPNRTSLTYCDGNFAIAGQAQTDWIVKLEHKHGKWMPIEPSGTVRYGLSQSCYTRQALESALAPEAFISRVPLCKAEDIGFFPQ